MCFSINDDSLLFMLYPSKMAVFTTFWAIFGCTRLVLGVYPLLFARTAFMIFFQHFFGVLVATRTFPCWKMMRLFVNVYSNHGRNKTNNRHKCKYLNPNCIWVFKHNYAILLLRILIVTNKLTTTNTIANVTGIAHAIEDDEKMLKKQ